MARPELTEGKSYLLAHAVRRAIEAYRRDTRELLTRSSRPLHWTGVVERGPLAVESGFFASLADVIYRAAKLACTVR